MMEAVNRLRELGVRICFEEIELDPVKDRIFDTKGNAIGVTKKRFSLRIEKKSVRVILDLLVARDRDYLWRDSQRYGLIEVLPTWGPRSSRSRSRLDWEIAELRVLNVGRLDLLKQDLDLAKHQIYFLWMGMDYDHYNTPVSIVRERAVIREVLNDLVTREPLMCWTLAGLRDSRFLTLHRLPAAGDSSPPR